MSSALSKINSRAPLDRSPKKNWVENSGGLPMYIRRIANHLHQEKGMTIGHAIAVAVNAVKKMCSTGDLNWKGKQNVNAKSRGEACAAVASWERKKAGARVSKGVLGRKWTDDEFIAFLTTETDIHKSMGCGCGTKNRRRLPEEGVGEEVKADLRGKKNKRRIKKSKEFPESDFGEAKKGQKCSRWGCNKPAVASRNTGQGNFGACAAHKKEMTVSKANPLWDGDGVQGIGQPRGAGGRWVDGGGALRAIGRSSLRAAGGHPVSGGRANFSITSLNPTQKAAYKKLATAKMRKDYKLSRDSGNTHSQAMKDAKNGGGVSTASKPVVPTRKPNTPKSAKPSQEVLDRAARSIQDKNAMGGSYSAAARNRNPADLDESEMARARQALGMDNVNEMLNRIDGGNRSSNNARNLARDIQRTRQENEVKANQGKKLPGGWKIGDTTFLTNVNKTHNGARVKIIRYENGNFLIQKLGRNDNPIGKPMYALPEHLGPRVRKSAPLTITDEEMDEFLSDIDSEGEEVAFDVVGDIEKRNDEQQMVFGWCSIAKHADGTVEVDKQGDVLEDIDQMEAVAYDFVLHSRDGGEMHVRKGVSTLVESFVSTPEKWEAMGIPEGTLPTGWWVGFKVNDSEVWKSVKNGKYRQFSVHGSGTRKALEDA